MTAFTAFLRLDTTAALGKSVWRKVSILIDDNAATLDKAVVAQTKKGLQFTFTRDSIWKTRTSAEKRAAHILTLDGRRSETALAMNMLTDAQLLTTDRKGKRSFGRTYSTTGLIDYVLTWDDDEYKSETLADRKRDADIIRAFLDYIES